MQYEIDLKIGESIWIGKVQVKILHDTYCQLVFGQASIGIEAPKHIKVWRQEIYERMQQETLVYQEVNMAGRPAETKAKAAKLLDKNKIKAKSKIITSNNELMHQLFTNLHE